MIERGREAEERQRKTPFSVFLFFGIRLVLFFLQFVLRFWFLALSSLPWLLVFGFWFLALLVFLSWSVALRLLFLDLGFWPVALRCFVCRPLFFLFVLFRIGVLPFSPFRFFRSFRSLCSAPSFFVFCPSLFVFCCPFVLCFSPLALRPSLFSFCFLPFAPRQLARRSLRATACAPQLGCLVSRYDSRFGREASWAQFPEQPYGTLGAQESVALISLLTLPSSHLDELAVWSRGMILASGARRLGLNSQNSPTEPWAHKKALPLFLCLHCLQVIWTSWLFGLAV